MSMKWRNVEMQLPQHAVILLVPARSLAGRALDKLACDGLSPDRLEPMLRELIVEARPSLANCCLWFMGFRPEQLAWEIGVEHPSLPVVAPYCEVRRENLEPELQEVQ